MPQYRAVFDAEISFVNGGGLSAHGFRLDLPSGDVDQAQIGALLVQHLGLALVGSVKLSGLQIVEEAHTGSRGIVAQVDAPAPRRLVDLSHVIRDGLVTMPGMPVPRMTAHLSREASRSVYAAGTEFEIPRIEMIANTGTYLDTAYHRYADGGDLAGLLLEGVVDVRIELIRLPGATERGIPAEVFYDREVSGAAVLLHTGWDRHFGTPAYGDPAPFLTEAGARYLVEQGVGLVGIDSINIDSMTADAAGERPAHSLLLAAGIPIVEHLTNLGDVPPRGATFTAVPPKVEAFGTFPVRAFATIR
ncbi:cyclase family protein [Naasia lichenicola]|uniref:Cyclase family protein n=1 Tax=Naasia lichenicola TaxID=2565933 RepID=A0A4S4FS06_9MICO|nr:cyclase family protein [Naasia lichenicola]THG33480.1 cyclase family protein [Naasia lichenicola]